MQHFLYTGNKKHACDLCHKQFVNKWVLKRHLLLHSGEKPYDCDACHKTFTLKSHLTKHLLHTDKKLLTCDQCQKHNFKKGKLKV